MKSVDALRSGQGVRPTVVGENTKFTQTDEGVSAMRFHKFGNESLFETGI